MQRCRRQRTGGPVRRRRPPRTARDRSPARSAVPRTASTAATPLPPRSRRWARRCTARWADSTGAARGRAATRPSRARAAGAGRGPASRTAGAAAPRRRAGAAAAARCAGRARALQEVVVVRARGEATNQGERYDGTHRGDRTGPAGPPSTPPPCPAEAVVEDEHVERTIVATSGAVVRPAALVAGRAWPTGGWRRRSWCQPRAAWHSIVATAAARRAAFPRRAGASGGRGRLRSDARGMWNRLLLNSRHVEAEPSSLPRRAPRRFRFGRSALSRPARDMVASPRSPHNDPGASASRLCAVAPMTPRRRPR